MISKKANLLSQTLVQIILIGLIFLVFLMATADKINGRGVKQQVLEKQTALLIDSAVPGMEFFISKVYINGNIQSVELKDGRVFISVDGLASFEGYPYFSKYGVFVSEEKNKFVIKIK